MRMQLYTDGAANYKTGEGAFAFLIKENEEVRYIQAVPLQNITSNQSEYMAVLYGLMRCHIMGADEVDVYTDSQLIIRQLSGYYGVRKNVELFNAVRQIISMFQKVRFHHIPGDTNPVHELAHQTYQTRQPYTMSEPDK